MVVSLLTLKMEMFHVLVYVKDFVSLISSKYFIH
jgi:hypothetical protein